MRQDGRILATAGWDNKVRIFSTKTCAPLAVLQVRTACLDKNCSRPYTVCPLSCILASYVSRTVQYHRAGVAAIAFNARTGDLASAGRDKMVAFWQVFQ